MSKNLNQVNPIQHNTVLHGSLTGLRIAEKGTNLFIFSYVIQFGGHQLSTTTSIKHQHTSSKQAIGMNL